MSRVLTLSLTLAPLVAGCVSASSSVERGWAARDRALRDATAREGRCTLAEIGVSAWLERGCDRYLSADAELCEGLSLPLGHSVLERYPDRSCLIRDGHPL